MQTRKVGDVMIRIECPQCERLIEVVDKVWGYERMNEYTYHADCQHCDYILVGRSFTRARALAAMMETHKDVKAGYEQWEANHA